MYLEKWTFLTFHKKDYFFLEYILFYQMHVVIFFLYSEMNTLTIKLCSLGTRQHIEFQDNSVITEFNDGDAIFYIDNKGNGNLYLVPEFETHKLAIPIATRRGICLFSLKGTLFKPLCNGCIEAERVNTDLSSKWVIQLEHDENTTPRKMAINFDETLFASLESPDKVYIWDLSKTFLMSGYRRPITSFNSDKPILDMCFISKYKIALSHPRGEITILQTNTNCKHYLLNQKLESMTGNIIKIVASRDNSLFATLEQDEVDCPIRVWNSTTEEFICGFGKGSYTHIYHIAFSHNNTTMLSVELGGTIKLWDIKKGNTPIGCLEQTDDFESNATFINGGKKIMSITNDKILKIYDIGQSA